ncbi:MAG TPA: response regulator [Anaerolineales bacterium]|nr:response regulator [Anaerolineales bacterium]
MPSILIADDNEDLRKVLAWLLQPRGYETLLAATGKEAIGKAIVAQPSLILLDLHLPDMNGVNAAQAIKKDQRTAHIPIVGWSAYFGEHWREEALRAGMVAYMEKPLSVPVIEATIKRFILAD